MADAPLPPAFHRLWVATVSSNLGDGIRLAAFPLLAATLTREPLLVGAVTAATMLPWLLGPVGGAMVDRGDRRRLLVTGQVARGVAIGMLGLAVLTDAASLALLYAVAVIVGLGEVIVDTATHAVVPAIVGTDQLDRANGRVVAATSVTGDVVGTPLGGVLFALSGAAPFLVDAATFGVAAVLLLTVAVPAQPVDEDADPRTFWTDVVEGMRALRDDRLLRPLAGLVGLVNVALTGAFSIFVLLVLDDLALTEGAYGVLLGVGALGGIGGSLVADRVRLRVGRGPTMVLATSAVTVGMTTLAASSVAWVTAAGLVAVYFAGAVFSVVGLSLRQAMVPAHLLGRVIASFRVIGLGGVPVGAFVGGAIASATTVRTSITFSAVLLGLVTVGMVFTVRRIPPEHR